jgi:CRP-like cAMP-binding protein
MPSPLVLKLARRDVLSPEEQAILDDLPSRVQEVEAREDIVRQGERPTESSLILEGWAARYTLLREGKRQITDFHMMGDFVDLHSLLLRPMDHAIVALTPCKVAKVPHETLREITHVHPHLGRLLWMNTLLDSAIHRHWLTAMGR